MWPCRSPESRACLAAAATLTAGTWDLSGDACSAAGEAAGLGTGTGTGPWPQGADGDARSPSAPRGCTARVLSVEQPRRGAPDSEPSARLLGLESGDSRLA